MYSYVVPYFTHNDLLEIFAELGIIGFLLYVYFFFLLFKLNYKLFNQWINKNVRNHYIYLILPLIIYFIDMNLNFPLDRPAIQIYLILYILTMQLIEDETNTV